MIIEKEFKCSFKDIDSVIVALADEIKNGWKVDLIRRGEFVSISAGVENYPEFTITLVR